VRSIVRLSLVLDVLVGAGRSVVKEQKDIASFKTPDLRNVLVTGPFG
jgi:cytochrome c peroxidase